LALNGESLPVSAPIGAAPPQVVAIEHDVRKAALDQFIGRIRKVGKGFKEIR
jgi:hypothetical protein